MSGPARAVSLLEALRAGAGGFAPAPGGDAEPEPTALAALALDDDAARGWLVDHQRSDGGFIVGPEGLRNDIATPLAAMALQGQPRERALDYLVGHRAQAIGFDERFPHDPETRGWGWTSLTFGWVEPTARAVHALKLLRPAAPEIGDGLAVLADRECSGGGWNYGNAEVLGRRLEAFLQTTAAGLIAVHDGPPELRDRAVAVVEALWPAEPGGLGWAMSAVALQLAGRDAGALLEALDALVEETGLLHDGVALAWAAVALGDRWQRLRVSAS